MSSRLSPEQVQKFRKEGFLLFPEQVVGSAELAELNAALKRVLAGDSAAAPERVTNLTGDERNVVVQVVNIWEAEPAFRRHLSNPAIVGMVADLMGADTVRVWHDQIQIKPAGNGGPTVWHQDHPYWPIVEPAELVSAWVALEDATIENGCMWMTPGSHKWGAYGNGTVGLKDDGLWPDCDMEKLPEGAKVEIVPCPVAAGSVVFHHCLTWHGAPHNASSFARPAIAVHYMPGHTRYVKEPGRSHLVEHHVEVANGDVLRGKHFPTVLEDGILVEAADAV